MKNSSATVKNQPKAVNVVEMFFKSKGACYTSVANGSITAENEKLYSYRTLIAIIKDGVCYINTKKYSATTSKQQNWVRRYSNLPIVDMSLMPE